MYEMKNFGLIIILESVYIYPLKQNSLFKYLYKIYSSLVPKFIDVHQKRMREF